MLRSALILALLAGCTTPIATEVTRAAARSVVNAEVQARWPGLPAEPVTDCIIDNATADELLTVGAAAATGPTERSAQIVGQVMGRPGTLACLGNEAIPTVLANL